MSGSYSFLSALLAQKQQAYGKALEYAVAAALLNALNTRGAQAARFDRPVLLALAAQLERLTQQYADAPAALVAYFLGRQDFYKLIVSMPTRTTTVQAFSFAGTLGQTPNVNQQNAAVNRPIVQITRLSLPTKLQAVAFKPHSDNTIILTFDHDWAF